MRSPDARAFIVLLVFLCGAAFAQQPQAQRASSNGLSVPVPLGYVSAQLGPGAIGLTAPDNGGVILVEALGRTADAAAVMDQTLSRIGARRFDDGLAVEGGSGVTAALSYERAGVLGALYAVDANGTLVVLRIEPLTPETAHTAQAVAAGVAYHAPEATASVARCGSAALPLALTTSGGLRACFGPEFLAEEKGPHSIGLSDLDAGIVVTIYAADDLALLLGQTPSDVESAAQALAQSMEQAGVHVLSGAANDRGVLSLPVSYPGVGAGRLMLRGIDGEVIALSALLLNSPPADASQRLDAIFDSVTVRNAVDTPGVVVSAPVVVSAGLITFAVADGWLVDTISDDVVQLTRSDDRAILRVTSARIGPNWNVDAYVAGVLSSAAQFAGDDRFTRESVTPVDTGDPLRSLAYYNSAVAAPRASSALQTGFLTFEPDVLAVFQALISDPSASAIVRADVFKMIASAERR
ncbi:MAG: hypothetical protein UZ13_01749 [Chloroflexi bacterium OLB13]|nr:MAG: hypothetical protein UZ13_01749 [Chloroflexi bacterium OLB13]